MAVDPVKSLRQVDQIGILASNVGGAFRHVSGL